MKVVVLGVGNTLLEDEGIGVYAAEALESRYHLPPDVRVVDGGMAENVPIDEMRAML